MMTIGKMKIPVTGSSLPPFLLLKLFQGRCGRNSPRRIVAQESLEKTIENGRILRVPVQQGLYKTMSTGLGRRLKYMFLAHR
jgi:hypothetical protein